MPVTVEYPGVYTVEVGTNLRPIEGVSTSTATLVGVDCMAKIQRLIDQTPQDATTGLALLELMAWITENLLQRMDPIPDAADLAAARLAVIALALVKDRVQPRGNVLKRIYYYQTTG